MLFGQWSHGPPRARGLVKKKMAEEQLVEDDGKRAFRPMDVVMHGVKPMGGGVEGGAACAQDLTRPPELPGAIWSYLSGAIWSYLELSGASWSYLELSGAIWCYLEISGAIWSYL